MSPDHSGPDTLHLSNRSQTDYFGGSSHFERITDKKGKKLSVLDKIGPSRSVLGCNFRL
jgi:hypothetical protein